MMGNLMNTTKVTLAVSLVFFSAGAAQAQQDVPGKDEVELVSTAMTGSGCGAGEEGGDITEGLSSTEDGPIDRIKISFGEFKAERPGKSRKFCNVAIELSYPEQWQFRLVKGVMVGRGTLQKGASSELKIDAVFRGQENRKVTKKRRQKGFWSGVYRFEDGFGHQLWSRCGKLAPLNLRFTASIRGARKEASEMTMTGTAEDGAFELEWRKCS